MVMKESVTAELLVDCPPELKQLFKDRAIKGLETYGTPLYTFNGRDARQDCIEELLDACQYSYQYYLELKQSGKNKEAFEVLEFHSLLLTITRYWKVTFQNS